MKAKELSILIPARNEEFLSRTIEDILQNIESDTEVLVGLDGQWAEPAIKDHPRVTIVYVGESIGQRAMTNMLCRMSSAKYVMKVDAHCAFRKGFDKSMIKAFRRTGDNVVMAPLMRNLHVFDWVCKCEFRHYQDKGDVCPKCASKMEKDILWIAKTNPESTSYCFDSEPHFQYFNEHRKTHKYLEEAKDKLTESMSLQGSCFMVTRDKYWELNISDESLGSWGSQGIEVACKFWLSGGRVIINHRTWYAHLFRTKTGVFGFPYPQKESQIQGAKKKVKELFFEGKWDKQTKPLSWLLERFWPVKGWTDEDLQKLKLLENK